MDHVDIRRQLFSVLSYAPDTKLYLIGDNYLGFGFLCNPLSGFDQPTHDKLNALLNVALPKNSAVQFCLWASPDLEALLQDYRYLRLGAGNAVLKQIAQDRVDFVRRGTADPVDRVSNIRLHDVRLLITVKVPTREPIPTDEETRKVAEMRSTFEQTLKTVGFAFKNLGAGEYVRIMSSLLNHGPAASWRDSADSWYDEQHLLCDQILDKDTSIDLSDPKQLLIGDKRVKLLHVKRYPDQTYFGMAMNYLVKYLSGERGIRENVLITYNIIYSDPESSRSKLERDRLMSTSQAGGRIAKFVPQLAERKADLDEMFRAGEDGDRFVHGYLGIAVFANSDEDAVAASANVRTYMRELGLQMLEDHFFCGPLFINLLPFKADVVGRSHLMRYHTFATRHVLPFLPVLGSWRGTGTPFLTLIARDGQVMPVSPFDSESNYNVIIAAQSGSGKSFLTQALITEARSQDELVRVVDVGHSYKNLCKVLNGQYVQFTKDTDICLNPFTKVQDFTEEADQLAGVLSVMIAPNQPLSDFQNQRLREVLATTFAQFGQDTTIDAIAAALKADKDHDTRVTDMGQQLYSFTKAGEYGRYFSGRNNLEANNPFMVCELEELQSRRHLQRVVLMILLSQTQQEFYLGDRSRRKYFICDEAWDLLASNETRDFITAAYRRMRKYNASAVTITQSITDYWSNAGAIAIVENSANKYFLKQNPESIDLAKREGRIGCGEFGYQLLNTIRTVKGEYSEILVMSDFGMGVGRLVVSEKQNFLYSTAPSDVAAIRQLEAQGVPLVLAIDQVAERRRAALRKAS